MQKRAGGEKAMRGIEITPPQFGEHGKSIEEFLYDGHFIRCLIGGRGSGKTRALIEDITRHLWRSAGGKAIIARQTETSQEDSSIDTAWQFFETLGSGYSTSLGLFKSWNNGRTFRVPSELAVKRMQEDCAGMTSRAEIANWIMKKGDALCGYIEFRGLPDADKGKFRGMECSYLALVEADQISKKQFDLSLACLRWKGVDPETCDEKGFINDRCVVLDTNPPSPSHWIAEMEEAEEKKPEHERIMRFWHIPTKENEHNLPENYIRDTILLPYASNQPMLDRMLHGKYADAYVGRPVFHAYKRECHEVDKLGWLKGASMVVSADVGTWNTSLISAFLQHGERFYWWALREIVLQDSDTERQAVALLQTLASEFPFWNQGNSICPEAFFFCDPAAANSNFSTGPTSSSVKIFASHGLHFSARMPDRGLQTSIATVNRLFEQHHVENTDQGPKTIWHFKINTAKCPKLTSALRGAYRYPEKGEVGYGSDLPLKGTLCDGADHSCFVAGTRIAGDQVRQIETIKVGDMVETRGGLRPVIATMHREAAVQTYRFSGAQEITCTSDHPFWCENRKEMVAIKNVRLDDKLKTDTDSEVRRMRQTRDADTEYTTVYNITVDQDHEYFANGILVSNCDGFRYGVVNALSLAKERHSSGMTSREMPIVNPEPSRRI